MSMVAWQFYSFIKKEKTRRILAFLFYFILGLKLPSILQIPFYFTFITISILGITICIVDLNNKIHSKKDVNILDSIITKSSKIITELCMALPIYIFHCFMVGKPANQAALDAEHQQFPILSNIYNYYCTYNRRIYISVITI